MNMGTRLKQEKETLLNEARAIGQKARGENRTLSADEATKAKAKLARIDEIDTQLKAATESDAMLAALGRAGDGKSGSGDGSAHRLAFSPKGFAHGLLKDRSGTGGPMVKSLLAEGSQSTSLELAPGVFAEPRPARTFLEVLGAQEVAPRYSYLRQVARTSNAAPVAPGGTKPTSAYTLSEVKGDLKVVAHVSEPVDTYMLENNKNLEGFLVAEMGYGLQVGVETQVLHGDGEGENFTGFASLVGIQSQAFDTTAILTARQAIGAIENLDLEPGVMVLHPTDWQAIETTQTTSEEFLFSTTSGPIDRVSRRLWGVPVALSLAATPGQGYLIAQGAAVLGHDGKVRSEWGTINDDFGRNQLRSRVEGQFDLLTPRPSGIVEIELVDPAA